MLLITCWGLPAKGSKLPNCSFIGHWHARHHWNPWVICAKCAVFRAARNRCRTFSSPGLHSKLTYVWGVTWQLHECTTCNIVIWSLKTHWLSSLCGFFWVVRQTSDHYSPSLLEGISQCMTHTCFQSLRTLRTVIQCLQVEDSREPRV